MANFSASNEIAVLSACRQPLWTPQSSYTGAPSSASSGVSVLGSVTSMWAIDLRPRTISYPGSGFPGRQVQIQVSVVDDSADYVVILDGTTVTYTAGSGDDEEAILNGIAMEISNNVTTNALVTSVNSDASGTWTLTITGRSDPDYTFEANTTGTGELTCVADPTNVTAYWWGYGASGPGNNTNQYSGTHWRLVGAGLASGVPFGYAGGMDIVQVNGIARYYIQLSDVTGTGDVAGSGVTITYSARVSFGPAQPE